MMLLGWVPLAILAPFFAPVRCEAPSGAGVVRDPLQHLPRGHARALGVVHAGAHAAGGGVVDVVAAGADRRRVLAGCCCWASVPGRGEWTALALVVAAMIAVLWVPKPAPAPFAPDN